MSKHAHSFTEAHEMEKLQEGTWYIKGCKELEEYFKTTVIYLYGGVPRYGYFIEDGRWEYSDIDYLQHRT